MNLNKILNTYTYTRKLQQTCDDKIREDNWQGSAKQIKQLWANDNLNNVARNKKNNTKCYKNTLWSY